jgi:nitrogen fixation protein NifZ
VNRLHILQRFHDYLAKQAPNLPPEEELQRGIYRLWLERAYQDFVTSELDHREGLRRLPEPGQAGRRLQFLRLPRQGLPEMMNARWEYGEAVRLTRNVRNDGTYPGLDPGAPLVRRGSIGYVVDVGTFLQDQIIYSVNFLDEGKIVGCREEELIGGDEPWTPSRFEFREKVLAAKGLSVGGEVLVPSAPSAKSSRSFATRPAASPTTSISTACRGASCRFPKTPCRPTEAKE